MAGDPLVEGGIDKLLGVQRPAVVGHIRSIRAGSPDAAPAEVIKILEGRYLTLVTASGAAAGASAAIPGVGTGVSLAISGVETATFLELSAMFAQSVTEINGVVVDDPDLARALVMTMVIGEAGTQLVRQLAAAHGVVAAPDEPWGILLARIPKEALPQIVLQVKDTFVKKFTASQVRKAAGRLIPFGIGAVVGGHGNHSVGMQIIESARAAFGPLPAEFPAGLDPLPEPPEAEPAAIAAEAPAVAATPAAAAAEVAKEDEGFQIKISIPKFKFPGRKG